MTDKTFTVAGVSTLDGKVKVRFANDIMRIKVLSKKGHTNIDLIDLPHAMTKAQIAEYMNTIGFAGEDTAVQEAIDYVIKKHSPKTNAKAEAPLHSAQAEEEFAE